MSIYCRKKFIKFTIAACLMLASVPALAHVDATHAGSGFGAGFMHPMTGLDHLLTMLAVGIWAAQNKRISVWALPLVFPIMMMFGALLAVNGIHFSGSETGIALSVTMLGLLIACAIKLPVTASCTLIGLFALAHGYAHGIELPGNDSLILFGAGFVTATLILHLLGIALSSAVDRKIASKAMPIIGAGIAVAGVFFLSSIA